MLQTIIQSHKIVLTIIYTLNSKPYPPRPRNYPLLYPQIPTIKDPKGSIKGPLGGLGTSPHLAFSSRKITQRLHWEQIGPGLGLVLGGLGFRV